MPKVENAVQAVCVSDEEISSATGLTIRSALSGRELSSMAVGGKLSRVLEPQSVEDISRLIRLLSSYGESFLVLGAGSNLIIPDSGVPGWIIRLGRGFRYLNVLGSGRFEVGGAYPLMTLSRELSQQGLSGLEFAGGIPASVGGAVRMNAGAHGGEMAQVLQSVTTVSTLGELRRYDSSELEFAYRSVNIPPGEVIACSSIKLVGSDPQKTSAFRNKCLTYRKETQPLHFPSAGSVFKNPSPTQSAGLLIERAGLNGVSIGGAKISEQHANWIVNEDRKASYEDVTGLIEHCRNVVRKESAVTLETEVTCW